MGIGARQRSGTVRTGEKSKNSHVDHLNTPRLVADATGATVWRWDQQEPFGVNVPDENPSGLGTFDLPLRLPGQYFDKETGLHYNMARNYWPDGGRYVEADPLGIATTWPNVPMTRLNPLYAYANNSPLRFVDPDGLKPYLFRVTVGGAVSLPGVAGQVFNLAVIDPIAGQTCNYTVSCIGAGWSYRGTPSFSFGASPVKWDDSKECSNCRQFEGEGSAGTIAVQIGPIGYTPVDWLQVPNGPRLDFSGWAGATFGVGGGTYFCRFSL